MEVAEANRRKKPRPPTRPGHLPASLTYPPTTLEVRGRESRTPSGKKNSDKFKNAEHAHSPAHAHRTAPMDGRDFNTLSLRLPPRGYPDDKSNIGFRALSLSYAHENKLGRTGSDGRTTVAIVAPTPAKTKAKSPGQETYPDKSARGELTLMAGTVGGCGRSETTTGTPARQRAAAAAAPRRGVTSRGTNEGSGGCDSKVKLTLTKPQVNLP